MIVAISGFGGTGKTTLAKALLSSLEREGLRAVLYTPTLRDLAEKRGVSLLEIQEEAAKNPRIDLDLDELTRRKVEELSKTHDVVIVASWLAIYVVENAFKVFLYAPFDVRVKRLAERDGISLEEARAYSLKREEQNRERWLHLYNIELSRLHEYAHVALNTGLLTLEEEVALLTREIKARIKT